MQLQISTLVKKEREIPIELKAHYESFALCLESDRTTDEMTQQLLETARAADLARVLNQQGEPFLAHRCLSLRDRLKRKDRLAWNLIKAAVSNTEFEDRFAKIELKLRSSHLHLVPKPA